MSDKEMDQFNEVINKLENLPELILNDVDRVSLTLSAQVSIAISLKRIADAITKPVVLNSEGLTNEFIEQELNKPRYYENK